MGCVNNTTSFLEKCISPIGLEHPAQSENQNQNNRNNNNEFADFFESKISMNNLKLTNNLIIRDEDKTEKLDSCSIPPNKRKRDDDRVLSPLLRTPKLKLSLFTNSQSIIIDEITITPNTIKPKSGGIVTKSLNYKFCFGHDNDCDYILNDANVAPKQFFIFYNPSTSKYNALDNLSGTGLFVKILRPIEIFREMIVSFCADHMYLQVIKKENNTKDIKIKFLQGKNINHYVFNSEKQKSITIGRGNKCTIKYDSDSVSKIHCTIAYENDNWVLYDGSLNANHQQKKSTNGLWLLCNVAVELEDKMILTTGVYKIKVDVIEPDS